jgi:hypothetical protein
MGDNADVAVQLEGLLPGHNLVVSFKIWNARSDQPTAEAALSRVAAILGD